MNELQQLEGKIRQALPRLQEMVSKGTVLGMHNSYKHQIYLSDVLEWFIVSYPPRYDTDQTSVNIMAQWYLSKPLLKDQPKEVIQYLNNLK